MFHETGISLSSAALLHFANLKNVHFCPTLSQHVNSIVLLQPSEEASPVKWTLLQNEKRCSSTQTLNTQSTKNGNIYNFMRTGQTGATIKSSQTATKSSCFGLCSVHKFTSRTGWNLSSSASTVQLSSIPQLVLLPHGKAAPISCVCSRLYFHLHANTELNYFKHNHLDARISELY